MWVTKRTIFKYIDIYFKTKLTVNSKIVNALQGLYVEIKYMTTVGKR